MNCLVKSYAAFFTYMPVGCLIFSPDKQCLMSATTMVALFQTLIIGITPVLYKLIGLYTESMLTTEFFGIFFTTENAESAVAAKFRIIAAFSALFAYMVIIIEILGTHIVFAMLPAVFAHMTVFAKLVQFEAFTAHFAKMLVPLGIIVRAYTMLAMVIFHTVLAESAILALIVIGASQTFRAEMIFIFAGFDTVTVGTALSLAVIKAAVYAKTAVAALLNAVAFGTFLALFT